MKDIGRYVEGCDLCQRIKNRTKEVAEKLKLSEVLEKLWTHLMVDFITKLLIVARKDVILVVCDRLSKMTYFVATTEGMLAEYLARLFRDNMWKLHGLLESVVLDREPQFAVELTKELNSVKIEEIGLGLFYFSFHFYFLFNLFFHFLFLEQLGLGLISHAVTTVT